MKYLGVDYGLKKVGLAISDDSGTFAFPYEVVLEADAIQKIKALVIEHEIVEVVVGKSVALDGTSNDVMKYIALFAEKIQAETDARITFFDERFSSKLADMHPDLKHRKPQTRIRNEKREVGKDDDAHAAAIILQSYLDGKKHS